MGIQTNKYVYEAYTTKLRYSHRLHDHVKVMNSHLLHFTALTTPDHRQVPLSEVAVRFHGNAWHVAPVCGRRETSELPSPQLEGVMGSAVRVIRGERDREGGGGRVRERRKREREEATARIVRYEGKRWRLNARRNYILIMHMEGIINS